MLTKQTLLDALDAYKVAADIEADNTVSYRVFRDSNKLRGLRGNADITLTRFNGAMEWLAANWPEDRLDDMPPVLRPFQPQQDTATEDAAA